ncbi:MAG: energy transducer TonB [Acidobacteriia bacterium]|nr:energy transducer TonB [Terriglobia bacterium]
MEIKEMRAGIGLEEPLATEARRKEPEYQFTFVESPNLLVSVLRQIRATLREPKITVPRQYYRGEARLPISEMRPWYRDLPNQLRILFEKPTHPIDIYNSRQNSKRATCAAVAGVVGAVAGWILITHPAGVLLASLAGIVVGELIGVALFKKREYPPDIWGDYRPQKASWVNSLLVHALMIAAMVLPFVIGRMTTPVKAAAKYEITDISPYLAQIEGPYKKMGGGGGGGDRSPTPASKGAIPKFSKTQFTPPMAVLPNLTPKLPMPPSLLGPPELKLPQMAMNMPWGDPQGVNGPPSNGPGFGGGIGSGEGTGIGSGRGGGLGPGEGGGFGGGAYSVGGNVSAPIPIYKPEPPYSEEARKAKYQGTVVLWIVVDAAGNVTDERVVKPLGLGLDEKALETVRTWKFKPGLRNGTPVPVRVMVEVSFRLF